MILWRRVCSTRWPLLFSFPAKSGLACLFLSFFLLTSSVCTSFFLASSLSARISSFTPDRPYSLTLYTRHGVERVLCLSEFCSLHFKTRWWFKERKERMFNFGRVVRASPARTAAAFSWRILLLSRSLKIRHRSKIYTCTASAVVSRTESRGEFYAGGRILSGRARESSRSIAKFVHSSRHVVPTCALSMFCLAIQFFQISK